MGRARTPTGGPPPAPRKAQASVRRAPLPTLPQRSFESPWEELAVAYESLDSAGRHPDRLLGQSRIVQEQTASILIPDSGAVIYALFTWMHQAHPRRDAKTSTHVYRDGAAAAAPRGYFTVMVMT